MMLATKLLFMGQMIDSDENWEFYSAYDFEKPSREEIKYLKGIIIPSSNMTIKNKVPKDETILKQFIKKGKDGASEAGLESSRGSSGDQDVDYLTRHAMNIIGDEMIPQNETWVEKLADFVKHIYQNHKHIKILGCEFGALLIAYALDGKIDQVSS